MEIVEGKAGPVGYDLELVEGKLQIKLSVGVEGVAASLVASIEPGHFLDKLKAVIPSQIDDAIIEVLKAALVKV